MFRIQIVEDNFELSELLSLVIDRGGFEVSIARNKKELEKKLVSFKPDLIILDVMLGKENGREICTEIKKRNPDVFIILLSANPELLLDYELCKADGVIEKPFDIHQVVDKIKSVLNLSGDI